MKKAYSKKRYFTPSHHHFAEIRESIKGKPYIVIDQSYRVGKQWKSQKLVIFEDELDGFIKFIHDYRKNLSNGFWKKEKASEEKNEKLVVDSMPKGYPKDPQEYRDVYEEFDYYDGEREKLIADLASDSEDFARSNEDGWFYGDDDGEER